MPSIRDFGPLDFEDRTPEQRQEVADEVSRLARAMYAQCIYTKPMWIVAEAVGLVTALFSHNADDPAGAVDDIHAYAHKHLSSVVRRPYRVPYEDSVL